MKYPPYWLSIKEGTHHFSAGLSFLYYSFCVLFLPSQENEGIPVHGSNIQIPFLIISPTITFVRKSRLSIPYPSFTLFQQSALNADRTGRSLGSLQGKHRTGAEDFRGTGAEQRKHPYWMIFVFYI